MHHAVIVIRQVAWPDGHTLPHEVLDHVIHFIYPVIDETVMALLLFFGELHLCRIRLDKYILFLLLLAEDINGRFLSLSYFGVWAESDTALVVLHILVVLELTVLVELEETDLLAAVPVFLHEVAFHYYFVLFVEWIEIRTHTYIHQ